MARYDKYDPYDGGFRAPLAADFGTLTNGADLGKIWAVSLDTNGKIVKVNATAGQTNDQSCGVMILTMERYAGDVVDIMTDGEITDIQQTTPWDNMSAAVTAGSRYFVNTTNDGSLIKVAAPVAGTNYTLVGRTVESNRLIVRCRPYQG